MSSDQSGTGTPLSETSKIIQGTQMWVLDVLVGFGSVMRGKGLFNVWADEVESQPVGLMVGQSASVGPFDMTLDGIDSTGDRDVAKVTLVRR